MSVAKGFKNFNEDVQKALKKAVSQKALLEVGKLGMNFGVALSPVKSGNLVEGWSVIPSGKKAVILRNKAISDDVYGFPYNLWVNENIPTVRMFGKGGQVAYRDTNNTGMPRFFDKTAEYVVKIVGKRQEVHVANMIKQGVKPVYVVQLS